MITLQQLFNASLDLGIKRSPRPRKEIEDRLKKLKKEYEKLDEKKKEYFDMESLKNPFLDSRILAGDPNAKLKRVLVGIDISVGEILLAHAMGKDGRKVDAVIAHHPEGRALIDLTQVMDLHEETLTEDGIPINVVQKLMRPRISSIDRGLHPHNNYQVPEAASLLGVNFANFHTFADNQAYWFVKSFVTKRKPKYVGDIMESLLEVPEFHIAKKMGNGPMVFVGDEKAHLGKISFAGFTGGTDGPKEMMEKMAQAGVGTLLAMHIPEESRKLAEKYHINVIITGHMASDSVGVNILMDEAEKKGVEVLACGGFIRVSRAGKKMPF